MLHYQIIASLLLLLLIAASWAGINKAKGAWWFANNAQIVNITAKGRGTKLAGPGYVFNQRYLIASRDLTDGSQYIQPYAAGTAPFAVVDDMTPTSETAPSDYPLPVDILGMCEDTKRGIAAGAIAADDLVYPVAGGTLASLRIAATGTYYIVGKCVWGTNAGAGDQVEFIPCFPYQVTVG